MSFIYSFKLSDVSHVLDAIIDAGFHGEQESKVSSTINNLKRKQSICPHGVHILVTVKSLFNATQHQIVINKGGGGGSKTR